MSGLFGGGKTNADTKPSYTGLQVQTSAAGLPIPLLWGTQRAAPNLIWYNDFASKAVSSDTGGGKGGGGSSGSYTYSCAVAMALCEGPIGTVGRVWADKDDTTLAKLNLTLFTGTADQGPFASLYTGHTDQAMAYPYTAYVAARTYDLGSSASLPSHNFEVQSNAVPRTGFDANPADILVDFLTNERYGVGLPADRIGDLTAWRTYCAAAGLFLSPLLSQQEAASDIVTRWAQLTNTLIYWSGDTLQALPLGDQALTGNGVTFTPDLTPLYDLNDDDFIAGADDDPVTLSRSDPADANNTASLEFIDRYNSYQTATAEVRDQAAIDAYGLRVGDVTQAHEICDGTVAAAVASLVLQRQLYVRNTYQFKLAWTFALLEPGDIVTLTDVALGLDKFPVRITQIDEDEDGLLTFTAEELPAGIGTATLYPTPTTVNVPLNTGVDPGDLADPVIFEPSPGLTNGVQQVWIGATGLSASWGGCSVWVSVDDLTYQRVGQITAPARLGTLAQALPAAGDSGGDSAYVTLATSRLQLASGTADDAAAARTLSLIGTEMFAYAGATLTGTATYHLSGLNRGLYSTGSAAHAAGAPFLRIDDAIFEYDLPDAYVGQRLYIKLTSFNIFQAAERSLADVDAYTYTPVGAVGMLPVPTGLTLAAETSYLADGTVQLGIRARWTPADAGMVTDTVLRWGVSTSGGVTDWQQVKVPAGATDTLLAPVIQATTYTVQAATSIGTDVRSAWGAAATITVGGVLAGATITNLELYGQGLDTTFVTRDIHITWQGNFPSTSYALGSEPYGTGSGFVNPYFADYVVEVYDPATDALLRTDRMTASEYIYTYDKNAGDAGGPHRTVKFSIRMEDKLGGLTDPPATLTVTNPPPAQVQITPLGISGGSVLLGFIQPSDVDYAGVNAWIGTTADVDTSGTPAASGYSAPLVIGALTAGQQYYGKVQTYDAFGSAGCPISGAFTWTEPFVTSAQLADEIIDDTKLTQDLAATIDLITDPATVEGSVAWQVAQEAAARGAAIGTVQTAIGNVATNVTSLAAVVNDANTGLVATRAQVTDFEQAQATTNSATASSISTLTAQVNNPTTGLPATLAAVQSFQSTQAGINTATANTISTLSTTVGSNTASIQTLATSVDGVEGEYSVRIETDSGGVSYVAGFGLINGGPGTSQFIVRADTFAIISPGGTVATAPFVVGVVDGQPMVVMNTAFIQNLNASVVTAGTFGAGVVYAGDVEATQLRSGSVATARLTAIGNDGAGWVIDGPNQLIQLSDGHIPRINLGLINGDIGGQWYDKTGRVIVDINDLGVGVASGSASVSAYVDGSSVVVADKGVWTTLATVPAFQVRGNACDVKVTFTATVQTPGSGANPRVQILRTNSRTGATAAVSATLTSAPYSWMFSMDAFSDPELDTYSYTLQAWRPFDTVGDTTTTTYAVLAYFNIYVQVRWFR
ncbi:MAG: phage tail protein [Azospirillaceae bacterium]|nr:phage tail protein [Azospirillaceae bacterium]